MYCTFAVPFNEANYLEAIDTYYFQPAAEQIGPVTHTDIVCMLEGFLVVMVGETCEQYH